MAFSPSAAQVAVKFSLAARLSFSLRVNIIIAAADTFPLVYAFYILLFSEPQQGNISSMCSSSSASQQPAICCVSEQALAALARRASETFFYCYFIYFSSCLWFFLFDYPNAANIFVLLLCLSSRASSYIFFLSSTMIFSTFLVERNFLSAHLHPPFLCSIVVVVASYSRFAALGLAELGLK